MAEHLVHVGYCPLLWGSFSFRVRVTVCTLAVICAPAFACYALRKDNNGGLARSRAGCLRVRLEVWQRCCRLMTPYAILPDCQFGCQCKYPVALVVKRRIFLELSDHAASRERGNTFSGFMEAIARHLAPRKQSSTSAGTERNVTSL